MVVVEELVKVVVKVVVVYVVVAVVEAGEVVVVVVVYLRKLTKISCKYANLPLTLCYSRYNCGTLVNKREQAWIRLMEKGTLRGYEYMYM